VKVKTYLLSGLFCMAGAISSLAATTGHDLKFNLAHIKNTKVFLGCHYGDKEYVQDSAKVDEKGNFEFGDPKELPGGVYFIMLNKRSIAFEFIIDKEQRFSMSADTSNYTKTMKVTGSEENRLFYEYLNFVTDKHTEQEALEKQAKEGPDKEGAKVKMDTLAAQVMRYKSGFVKKHADMLLAEVFNAAEEPVIPPTPTLPNGRKDSTFPYHYYKSHFFDNVNLSDGRLVRSPVMFPKIKEYLDRLTVQDPDSIIVAADYLIMRAKGNEDLFKFLVAYITSNYESSNIMGMDAVFVHMAEKYYTPELATWVSASQLEKIRSRAAQLEPITLGKKPPELVMPDTNDVMQAYDSIKANFTLLYFWDYDCGHCQKETPKLIRWYDSIKGEGVEVYAVQTNEAPESITKWKDYIKAHKLDWMNVTNKYKTSNFRHDYDVLTTPMLYLLDENKHIIAKKIDTEDLDKIIKHYKERKLKP